jgi:hypothetical protein
VYDTKAVATGFTDERAPHMVKVRCEADEGDEAGMAHELWMGRTRRDAVSFGGIFKSGQRAVAFFLFVLFIPTLCADISAMFQHGCLCCPHRPQSTTTYLNDARGVLFEKRDMDAWAWRLTAQRLR